VFAQKQGFREAVTMTRQGCCVVATQDASILDRLEGLSKVIPPEVIEQALLQTGRDRQKACLLSHRVMLWIVLAMGVLTHLPIRQVFKHARRMRSGEKTPSRSNLCEGRLVEEIHEIREIDMNPVFALAPGQGCRIVDARIAVGVTA
jgi:Insertion element 4 transposase N-terminal